VKYYGNHHTLTGHKACPHSPCRQQFGVRPEHLCKDAKGYVEGVKWCSAMASISPEQIAGQVLSKL
jgi:hypothetical protein